MSDKLTPEDFKPAFRCFRGEEENPYAESANPNAKAWALVWQLESIVAKQSPEEIVGLWNHSETKPEMLTASELPESEKATAFAVYTAADTFMTESALADYLKWPVVEAES